MSEPSQSAGEQQPETPRARPGARERGRMRRRLREQRRVREALLLDLGALVFELHRHGRREPELLQAKASELSQVDAEVRGLTEALDADLGVVELVAAGISGTCENCGGLLSVGTRFCPACGAAAKPGLEPRRAEAPQLSREQPTEPAYQGWDEPETEVQPAADEDAYEDEAYEDEPYEDEAYEDETAFDEEPELAEEAEEEPEPEPEPELEPEPEPEFEPLEPTAGPAPPPPPSPPPLPDPDRPTPAADLTTPPWLRDDDSPAGPPPPQPVKVRRRKMSRLERTLRGKRRDDDS